MTSSSSLLSHLTVCSVFGSSSLKIKAFSRRGVTSVAGNDVSSSPSESS